MDPARLVAMANQIAVFFRSYPHDEAVASVESHIRQFWDPRMRARLVAYAKEGGEGLDPLVAEAVRAMAEPAAPTGAAAGR